MDNRAAAPLVILNPAANRGKMQRYRALIRARLLQESGADYVETSHAGEAQELAHQAALADRPVIIVGGDGSLNEVVNGILATGKPIPLGLVPAGSGNDFAWHTLKLPRDPAAAIEVAFSGQPTAVDAGIVNGHYFANAFSIGLDADIAVAANAMKKIPLLSGAGLYYAAVLRELLFGYHRCPWLTFHLDDKSVEITQQRRYVLIAVSNGPAYGGGFRINPNADTTDGRFDICTIDYAPLLRALKLLPTVQKGLHAGLPEVTFYRARTVHIESARSVAFQIDGEPLHTMCVDAQILPGALHLRV